jgi:AraC-like DNA-binding protein/DNA gyrase inhibitor GyrI
LIYAFCRPTIADFAATSDSIGVYCFSLYIDSIYGTGMVYLNNVGSLRAEAQRAYEDLFALEEVAMNHSHIEAAIAWMEEHLYEPLNIEQMSRLSYISSMQLYREFYSLTGHSVKEYVRKRRLSCALASVKHTGEPLAEIAHTYGYSSQQAFNKSIKAATGQTPLTYRNSEAYYYFPPYEGDGKRQVYVAAEEIPQTIRVQYHDNRLEGIENRAINCLFSLLPGYTGRLFGKNGRHEGDDHVYELLLADAMPYLEQLRSGPFHSVAVVPGFGSTWASLATVPLDEQIAAAWNYLYTVWLPASMFAQTELPYFEEYIHRAGKVKKLILRLPITKRGDYDQIRLADCTERRFLVSRRTGRDAEEQASRILIDTLAQLIPGLVPQVKDFYVALQENEAVCGIGLDGLKSTAAMPHLPHLPILPAALPPDIELLTTPAGKYAILEGACRGDSQVYERILSAWVADNQFVHDATTPFFTVYTYGKPNNTLTRDTTSASVFARMK